MTQARTDTPDKTPLLELLLGYGPALVILAAGALALAGLPYALTFGSLWAAAILIFLAGVVRGLSFFTEGGPRLSQVAVMMVRFSCGLVSLVLPPVLAMPVLAAGYLSSLVYDPFAARNGAAPRYFARLRPPQMAIALGGLVLLWLASTRV
ncbi:hypothetical protein HNO88_001220 [Novosphingobium chloroacetimidivorans]|uniref:DUF3429 domain-containing protein n=1 Tax=Novosphingobium chloroacetimidivorans TaxID=1428314 RepID=A0A7W7K822_9SPHN|nr:DUF3429 domain-containing protein [Novosphingobium chloroacetimidivorans]MBB4857906.1 hypothetical protein [Novosphingobium chloroacetimidivorans]